MSIITLVALLTGVGLLWFLAGFLERLATPEEPKPCAHINTDYSYTLGTTRCMECGAVVDQETWD